MQPCQNGGTCTPDDSDDGFTCTCETGYFGAFCTVSLRVNVDKFCYACLNIFTRTLTINFY